MHAILNCFVITNLFIKTLVVELQIEIVDATRLRAMHCSHV